MCALYISLVELTQFRHVGLQAPGPDPKADDQLHSMSSIVLLPNILVPDLS